MPVRSAEATAEC
uniref:Uncharacterized protein n=1 Tax=Anguilla anguilla TaxID=7936 RepID=A0A0E9UZJ9_ANGAN